MTFWAGEKNCRGEVHRPDARIASLGMKGGANMTMNLTARLPDVDELTAEADALERKARALRQIAEGIKALNGDAAALLVGSVRGATAATSVDGPLGREAIRRIVAGRPGVWKVADLKEEARARGYPISDTGVEKAVRRMLDAGEAEKAGYGRYRFGVNGKEGAGEKTASDGAMIPLTP